MYAKLITLRGGEDIPVITNFIRNFRIRNYRQVKIIGLDETQISLNLNNLFIIIITLLHYNVTNDSA